MQSSQYVRSWIGSAFPCRMGSGGKCQLFTGWWPSIGLNVAANNTAYVVFRNDVNAKYVCPSFECAVVACR